MTPTDIARQLYRQTQSLPVSAFMTPPQMAMWNQTKGHQSQTTHNPERDKR